MDCAQDAKFKLPESNFWVKFFIPTFQSWSLRKRARHHFKPHQQKPDVDNLIKAFKDSLSKEDKATWDYRISKLWVDSPNGYIEVWDIS